MSHAHGSGLTGSPVTTQQQTNTTHHPQAGATDMTDEDLDAMLADTAYWADWDAKHGTGK
jgi:hypothetical protein